MNDSEWGKQSRIKMDLLNKKEHEIKNISLRKVEEDVRLHGAYEIIAVALDITNSVCIKHKGSSDNELTIQKLGIRLFTNGATSINLLLSGYYQRSLDIVRDNVEILFLLDYLIMNPTQIEVWRTATQQVRKNKFKPVKIREALDARDGYIQKNRNNVYSRLSELASHATQDGFQLFKDPVTDLIMLGPFFEPKKQTEGIFEIALHQINATKILIEHFKSTSIGIAESIKHFNSYSESWLNANYPDFTYADNNLLAKYPV